MTARHAITRADIADMAAYAAERAAHRARVIDLKRRRRLEVGPFATLYFESYETMWHQVHEMLFIERGGEDQIAGELAAYNPLIPKGDELVATAMFEIDDATRRRTVLGRLGGVEETAFLRVGAARIGGVPETDVERTTAAGKASSVQFIRFPFTPDQIAAFRAPDTAVVVGFAHDNYGHMAVMPEAVRAELAGDFAG